MTLPPGTIIEGSSDPRTVEQNAAIRRMQTESGVIGSQYVGCLVLPDGTITRDLRYLNKPPMRVTEIDAVLNAAGKPNSNGTISGGYVLILNIDGVPVQYIGVSADTVQTNAEQAFQAAVSPSMQSNGITHRAAIELAMQGVQTDGTPVTDAYLDLMERWAKQEGIPFSRPSAARIAAVDRPAPASVVIGSGQGIAAVPTGPVQNFAVAQETKDMANSPTFTQGAILSEDFVPVVLRTSYVPQQETYQTPVTQLSADTETAPATTVTDDASVMAAKNKTTMLALAVGLGVLIALAYAGRKG